MTIKINHFEKGMRIKSTICSNRIFVITKITNKFVWIKRTPELPTDLVYKYRKTDLCDVEEA